MIAAGAGGTAGPVGATPRARSVVLDADSTLAGIEGIDWLAARRPAAVAAEIAALTEAAMAGTRVLDEVYRARLDAVAPSRAEVEALASAYVASLAPGATECVVALHEAGVRVVIVSGGLRPALLPLAARLGIAAEDVHAVDIVFDHDDRYLDYERASPLTQQRGKPAVVRALALPRPVLAVGDGSTDLAIRLERACDAFAAYTGFVRRASVVAAADLECPSFDALQRYIMARDDRSDRQVP